MSWAEGRSLRHLAELLTGFNKYLQTAIYFKMYKYLIAYLPMLQKVLIFPVGWVILPKGKQLVVKGKIKSMQRGVFKHSEEI